MTRKEWRLLSRMMAEPPQAESDAAKPITSAYSLVAELHDTIDRTSGNVLQVDHADCQVCKALAAIAQGEARKRQASSLK